LENFPLDHLGRHGAELLVDDDPFFVDQERLRCGIYAEIDGGPAAVVGYGHGVGIAETPQPGLGILCFVAEIQADDRQGPGCGQLFDDRVFDPAGHAPTGPEVHQERLADQVFAVDDGVFLPEQRQRERRHGPAHQR
jgi:hypothetical protein